METNYLPTNKMFTKDIPKVLDFPFVLKQKQVPKSAKNIYIKVECLIEAKGSLQKIKD